MADVTWNPNVLRMINLVDSEEIQPVRGVPDHHGSQDIEKSEIRTRKVTRTYLGEIIFFEIPRPVGVGNILYRLVILKIEEIHDRDNISDPCRVSSPSRTGFLPNTYA